MMKIFFDTEFIDNPVTRTIEPISFGLVKENGQKYYAEVEETDLSQASDWVKKNVFPYLSGKKTPRAQIAQEIRLFCGASPEFWAWFGAYDFVMLCQLYGTMLDVPTGWPNLYYEIVQFAKFKFKQKQSIPDFKKLFPNGLAHNALADAEWNKKVWDHINSM